MEEGLRNTFSSMFNCFLLIDTGIREVIVFLCVTTRLHWVVPIHWLHYSMVKLNRPEHRAHKSGKETGSEEDRLIGLGEL